MLSVRERLKLGVMGFTEHHIQHYREHGYAIVENFLSPDELSRSRADVEAFIPGWLDYAQTQLEIDLWVGMNPSDLVEACGFHSVENN